MCLYSCQILDDNPGMHVRKSISKRSIKKLYLLLQELHASFANMWPPNSFSIKNFVDCLISLNMSAKC